MTTKTPIPRDEFLAVVRSSASIADAARQLGVTDQSVGARLARLGVKVPTRRSPIAARFAGMTDKDLEAAHFAALDNGEVPIAQAAFDEMCRRVQEKAGGVGGVDAGGGD